MGCPIDHRNNYGQAFLAVRIKHPNVHNYWGYQMAKDIGEEIVGTWLREIAGCDFVQYNVPTIKQGEIDVVGLKFNLQPDKPDIYICEVATHLDSLLYVASDGKSNNTEKLIQKYVNAIEFAKRYLDNNFNVRYMFWSPIVKDVGKKDLAKLHEVMKQEHGTEIEFVINKTYLRAVYELIGKAGKEKRANESPVFRLFQILMHLDKHLEGVIFNKHEDIQKALENLLD